MRNDFSQAHERDFEALAMTGLRSAAAGTSDPEQAPLIASRTSASDGDALRTNVEDSTRERWIAYLCFLVLGVRKNWKRSSVTKWWLTMHHTYRYTVCFQQASVLLPWYLFSHLALCQQSLMLPCRNLLIVVTPYFTLRLRGSSFSSSAATWVPLSFTAANFVWLAWATRAQGRDGFLHVKRNIYGSILAIGAIILMLYISTHFGHIAPFAFLALMM